jgi:hypothetical protein
MDLHSACNMTRAAAVLRLCSMVQELRACILVVLATLQWKEGCSNGSVTLPPDKAPDKWEWVLFSFLFAVVNG